MNFSSIKFQLIGYVCVIEAIALTLMAYFTSMKYRQVPNEDEADLVSGKCREMSPITHTNHHDYNNSNPNQTNNIIETNDNGYAYNNHINCNQTMISPTECNQKPYIPGKLIANPNGYPMIAC